MPAGLVFYMRSTLQWDVLYVLEERELRRAPDVKHYRLAEQLRRTLVTLDRDYLDDRQFPPMEGAGVLVIDAPNERELSQLLTRVDRALFGGHGVMSAASETPEVSAPPVALPLEGRKLHVHTDWGRDQ